MRDHDRHVVFEFVVFGTALVLAGVLAYYSWLRFRPQGAPPERSAVEIPEAPQAPSGNLEMSPTVRAVPYTTPAQGSGQSLKPVRKQRRAVP